MRQVFCLSGTNPGDHDVALGLSFAVVGARSDGLVQIDKAAVPGSHGAFVHRSHSGRYGLVNCSPRTPCRSSASTRASASAAPWR
ncbi:hypothetical protein ABT382_35900 [Streptomyces pharetrae]|uniref:hypothetical protein n=1 Tax=Streptomyces pharetrae TaxID=291370 RepID=UPI003358FB2E